MKLDGNYTRMLRAILNKSWRQRTKYTATCLLSQTLSKLDESDMRDTAGEAGDDLISDVLLWTPHIWPSKSRTTCSNIQLCEDTGCSPEDLSEEMNDREKWR